MHWIAGETCTFAYGAGHGYLVIVNDREVRLSRFSVDTVAAGMTAAVAREAAASVIILPLGRGPGRPGGELELSVLAESARTFAECFEAGEDLDGYPGWQHHQVTRGRDGSSPSGKGPTPPRPRPEGGTPPSLEKVSTPPRFREALKYRCPQCQAEPGRDCRTAKGLPTLTPHVARQDLHLVNTGKLVLDEPPAGSADDCPGC